MSAAKQLCVDTRGAHYPHRFARFVFGLSTMSGTRVLLTMSGACDCAVDDASGHTSTEEWEHDKCPVPLIQWMTLESEADVVLLRQHKMNDGVFGETLGKSLSAVDDFLQGETWQTSAEDCESEKKSGSLLLL